MCFAKTNMNEDLLLVFQSVLTLKGFAYRKIKQKSFHSSLHSLNNNNK